MKILVWFDNGYWNVFNKVCLVVMLEDMDGLKIWVMESLLMVNIVNVMGGLVMLMFYSELYIVLE